jgi:hypothetical protein
MRAKNIEIADGKITITVETKIFFWKKETRYLSAEKMYSGYWNWLQLPDKNIVPDLMTHQLNAWANEKIKQTVKDKR